MSYRRDTTGTALPTVTPDCRARIFQNCTRICSKQCPVTCRCRIAFPAILASGQNWETARTRHVKTGQLTAGPGLHAREKWLLFSASNWMCCSAKRVTSGRFAMWLSESAHCSGRFDGAAQSFDAVESKEEWTCRWMRSKTDRWVWRMRDNSDAIPSTWLRCGPPSGHIVRPWRL